MEQSPKRYWLQAADLCAHIMDGLERGVIETKIGPGSGGTHKQTKYLSLKLVNAIPDMYVSTFLRFDGAERRYSVEVRVDGKDSRAEINNYNMPQSFIDTIPAEAQAACIAFAMNMDAPQPEPEIPF